MENQSDAGKGMQTEARAEAGNTFAGSGQAEAASATSGPEGAQGVQPLTQGAMPLEEEGAAKEPESADSGELKGDAEAGPQELGYDPAALLPEGFEPDQEVMDEFREVAREIGIPKEGAEKLMGLAHKIQEKMLANSRDAHVQQMQTIWAEQMKQIKAHPEFGGVNYEKSREYVGRAVRMFGGTPDENGKYPLAESLKNCGMANDPELYAALARIGRFASEADTVASDAAAMPREKSLGEILHPDKANTVKG